MREGWRFALVECGVQCVMKAGITVMQQWCVDNWDTQGVSHIILHQQLNRENILPSNR